MKKRLRFDYDILLEFDRDIVKHVFALRCLPPSFPGQFITDARLKLDPFVPYSLQCDSFGNLIQYGRVDSAHHSFHYSISGSAVTDTSARQREPALPVFRFTSEYTAMTDELKAFSHDLSLSGTDRQKAYILCCSLNSIMEYSPGSTIVSTTAGQAFSNRKGVCQDFAHIFIALARENGMYVRYANGLTEGEGASHAWCEIWLDGIWTGIDPTRGQWCDESYIRFNTGRDFNDCPMERGVFTGLAAQKQSISMRVTEQ